MNVTYPSRRLCARLTKAMERLPAQERVKPDAWWASRNWHRVRSDCWAWDWAVVLDREYLPNKPCYSLGSLLAWAARRWPGSVKIDHDAAWNAWIGPRTILSGTNGKRLADVVCASACKALESETKGRKP